MGCLHLLIICSRFIAGAWVSVEGHRSRDFAVSDGIDQRGGVGRGLSLGCGGTIGFGAGACGAGASSRVWEHGRDGRRDNQIWKLERRLLHQVCTGQGHLWQHWGT